MGYDDDNFKDAPVEEEVLGYGGETSVSDLDVDLEVGADDDLEDEEDDELDEDDEEEEEAVLGAGSEDNNY